MKDCGVNHVKVSAIVVGNNPAANNNYHRSLKVEVTRQLSAAQRVNDASFSFLNDYHDLEKRFDKSYHRCNFLRFLTVIGADQMVYSCQDKAYTEGGLIGSLIDKTFKEFWFSEFNQKYISTLDPSVECRHHCVTHPKKYNY